MKKQLKFLVFDTETTGLTLPSVSDLSKQPKIIEFGALITDGKEILKTYNQLINPGEQITAEIMKITGITNDDLKDKPRFGEVYSEIKDFRITSYNVCYTKLLRSTNYPFRPNEVFSTKSC